jgi:hypothetical protein
MEHDKADGGRMSAARWMDNCVELAKEIGAGINYRGFPNGQVEIIIRRPKELPIETRDIKEFIPPMYPGRAWKEAWFALVSMESAINKMKIKERPWIKLV